MLSLCILAAAPTTSAQAQDNSVEIDFSVLEGLGEFDDYSEQKRLRLREERQPSANTYRQPAVRTSEFVTLPAPLPLQKPPQIQVHRNQTSSALNIIPYPEKKPTGTVSPAITAVAPQIVKAPAIVNAPVPPVQAQELNVFDHSYLKPKKPATRSLLNYGTERQAAETAYQSIDDADLPTADTARALLAKKKEGIYSELVSRESYPRREQWDNIPDTLSQREEDLIEKVLNQPTMLAPADDGKPLVKKKEKTRYVPQPINNEPTAGQLLASRHVKVHKNAAAQQLLNEIENQAPAETLTQPVYGLPYPEQKPDELLEDVSDAISLVPKPLATPLRKLRDMRLAYRKKKGVPIMPAVPAGAVEAQPLTSEITSDEISSGLMRHASAAAMPDSDITHDDISARFAADRRTATDLTENRTQLASLPQTAQQDKIPRLPPKDDSYEQDYITLPFAPETADLTEEISRALSTNVIPKLTMNQNWRLQIQAFASAQDRGGISGARRMSLSRALSIRSFLLDQGIEPHRMDVRALGIKTDRTPLDRVDLVFFDPEDKE